jgi:hypothetical protein
MPNFEVSEYKLVARKFIRDFDREDLLGQSGFGMARLDDNVVMDLTQIQVNTMEIGCEAEETALRSCLISSFDIRGANTLDSATRHFLLFFCNIPLTCLGGP